jgi:ribosomal protein S18 acetylase RimI-like enzyme
MTAATQSEPITAQPVQSDADFWRVRDLLIETYSITPISFNWDVRRWDGKYFYNPGAVWGAQFVERVRLWETADGHLVGVVNPEGEGDLHLQLHPDYRHLEDEMVAWGEEHLAAPGEDGRRRVEIFVLEYDTERQELLARRGFARTPWWGMMRRTRLAGRELPPVAVTPGYRLRTTDPDDLADCQRIADILNAAFGRTFHNAAEYQMFALHAPCFRRDLDLVAETSDGTFAAYVGIPYDEANRHGIFEPVCTHPGHRRHGLAQALMIAGLHRLRALGAADVTVETGDMEAANRLYDSLGFTEVVRGYIWRKEMGAE